VVGRRDAPGRPALYGTSARFLELFGLGSLRDLPELPAPDPGESGTTQRAASRKEAADAGPPRAAEATDPGDSELEVTASA
jgi:segregation and condensation protein B